MGGGARAKRGAGTAGSSRASRRKSVVLAKSCSGTPLASILAAADELRASRVGWGDVPRLGQGAGHPRITQRYRVGAREPKQCSLGVAGKFFGDLPDLSKSARRDSREGRRAPPRIREPLESTRHARSASMVDLSDARFVLVWLIFQISNV